MLESCYKPLERCFGGGGDDGLLWHMDLKPHASGEYSIAVVQANSLLEDQGQVLTSPSATYIGVYDGHGGAEASRFINNHLFLYLQKFAAEHGGLSKDVIEKAFDATETDFLHLVKESWLDRPQIVSVGSCCLVGVITNGTLFVANLGDSRAVLGRRATDGRMVHSSTVVAERLSTDHNVGVEEVRKEVKALHPEDSHIVIHTHGVWRIKGIIQVSRSIGDVYLKKPEYNRNPLFHQYASPIPLKRAVMSAEPSILTRKLRPQDLFLVFASDGLWEQLSDDTVVDIVHKNPRNGIARRLIRAAIEVAARKREMRYDDIKRIEKGVRRHFHDDITVVVIYLDYHQGWPNGNGKFKDDITDNCTTAPLDIFTFNSDNGDLSP
ncbi:probable protein phosphatase 2C 63 isoform X1 [Cynara cardunculus var. scolymus]|uniref:protein-serine/threonine phosphatase n=1 Tax=Cynara cardunculus var. scolymus TaxID=59895 RepID=A0A118K5D8_CYNCS|nr:probable protein phosphatase 2C 63 isoform X1 [Cynara cardunculus var. scolymus]KVI08956.1 Protein phosphatase 2C [Cynara cardunculus var. scolymus]